MNAIASSERVPWTRDCFAAGRLLWARWGTTLAMLWLCSALGLIATAIIAWGFQSSEVRPQIRDGFLFTILSLTHLPLLLYSIFAIDWWGQGGDTRVSGFDAFLLRSPIPSSRLVAVVVVARMTAIAVSLTMISIGVWLVARSPSNIQWGVYPALLISLSTTSIAVLAFCWRPFSWNGFRIMTLLVLIPAGYTLMVLPLMLLDLGNRASLGFGWLFLLFLLLWVGVIWVTYRSLELARCHSYGLQSSEVSWLGRIRLVLTDWWSRVPVPSGELTSHRTPVALAWFDARQTRATRWGVIGWAGIPMLVILVCLPLNGATVVIAGLMVLTYVVMATAGGWGEMQGMNRGSQGRSLPLILAVCPVPRETLAGVKIGRTWWVTLSASVVVWGTVAIVCLPLNWTVWKSWSSEMVVGEVMSATAMGFRVSSAIALASTVFLLGRGLALLWLALMADRRVTYPVNLLMVAVMIYGLVRVGAWFFVQTDWELMLADFRAFPARIPGFMVGLLLAKLTAVAVALVIAAKQPGQPIAWIAKTLLGWAIAVVLFAAGLAWLIPGQIHVSQTMGTWKPETVHVWMAVVLSLPLARLLILPWAIGRDLHR